MVEYYNRGILAHAYLIETNDVKMCMEVLLNVVKNIFCNCDFSPKCNKCSLCHLIDINNLPSLLIIAPDGNFIKKEQILELKELFSTTSSITKEQIYIIKNAEKMNKESANTMLKFLEEPNEDLIGFFITDNKANVIPTIQSRCQIITANFESDNNLSDLAMPFDEIVHYIEDVENNKSILINKKFKDIEKKEIIKMFKIILNIYKDSLDAKINNKKEKYEFLEKYSFANIKSKIKLMIEVLDKLNYNINVLLQLDAFVLEMDVINNEVI